MKNKSTRKYWGYVHWFSQFGNALLHRLMTKVDDYPAVDNECKLSAIRHILAKRLIQDENNPKLRSLQL